MCIQETHCKSDNDFCQSVTDMRARLNVFHSPAVEGDGWAGVMVILSQDWEVIDVVISVPGRVMAVKVRSKLFDERMNFVAVYGKTGGNDQGAWIDGLSDVMDPAFSTVVLGDFNFVMEERDRQGGLLSAYDLLLRRRFRDKMDGWLLRDVFRELKGDEEDFTFTHLRGAKSRIDRIYVEDDMIGEVAIIESHSVLGQDVGHKMVTIHVNDDLVLGKGYWKLNVSLLRDSNYADLIRDTWIESRQDKAEFANVGEWWDFAKKWVKNKTIEYAKAKRKEERRVLVGLQREKQRIEQEIEMGYASVFAQDRLRDIQVRMQQEVERKAEGHRIRARVPNWETKDPGIAYFSREEKKGSKRNLIHALRATSPTRKKCHFMTFAI